MKTHLSLLFNLFFSTFLFLLIFTKVDAQTTKKKKTSTTVVKKAPVKKKPTTPVKKSTSSNAKPPVKKEAPSSIKKTEAPPKQNTIEENKPKQEPTKTSYTNTTQNKSNEEKKNVNNLKFADKFIADLYIGFTSSFAHGDFINYHKSFYDVSDPNTKITGKIKPVYFLSFGTNFYYSPFYKNNGALSNLGLLFGLAYVKKGFASIYSSEYKSPNQDITDITIYTEKYRLNYFTRQLSIRYGKKFFVELGLQKSNLLAGYRKQLLSHEVSGSDAYAGGFKNKSRETNSLDNIIMDKKGTGYIVGLGWRFSTSSYVRLSYNNSSKVFNQGMNFKNHTVQIQLAIPFYNHSFFKK